MTIVLQVGLKNNLSNHFTGKDQLYGLVTKNWVTRTCCYCGEKFPINRKFCNMYERETDASYCAACQKKLFGDD